VLSWEQKMADFLHRIRMDHIKRKILVFSLLATLIPSLSMGSLFYMYAKRFVTDKVVQKLGDVTAQDSRELDLWLKERLYEARVYASSYVVSENLDRITRAGSAPDVKAPALHRLNDYLKSVGEKFIDYEELVVVGIDGHTVATSARRARPLDLPADWRKRAKSDSPIMTEAFRDKVNNKVVMLLAVPIKSPGGRFLGALVVKLNFHTVEEVLGRSPLGKTGQSYLMARDGTLIAGPRLNPSKIIKVKHPFDTVPPPESNAVLLQYADYHGEKVVGVYHRMSQLGWGVVAQIGKDEIYAEIMRIRILTVLICLGLLLVIGFAAYILGLTIVRPIDRLTDGAAKVAAGNLEVKLPLIGRGEIGFLTEAFNNMVARLCQGQVELTEKNKELQVLSITDSLTGLYNRKHFVEVLTGEVARYRRSGRPFAVMMIDTDHFKKYNDTYGHQTGDALLKKIGAIFGKCLRDVDYASRYGGDEFLILLTEVEKARALEVAERIRHLVAAEAMSKADRVAVTISIGVAAFPEDGDSPEAVIASADVALYHAKNKGRNRVVLASRELRQDAEVTK
jgi:diguanylate cyclase (GGDEF)-like protein